MAASTAPRLSGGPRWDSLARGTPEDLSPEQAENVAAFLKRVPKEHMAVGMRFPAEPENYFACRCLRARKFDVDEALKVAEATFTWRREKAVDKLGAHDPQDVLGCLEDELYAYYPKAYFPTTDKEGRPVYVEKTGNVDVDAMFLLTDLDKLVDYHLWCNEAQLRPVFTKASEAAGRPITNFLAILDLDGVTLKTAGASTRAYIAKSLALDNAYYPETLGKMLIINAPSFFSTIWSMVKGLLDERTVRKIEILSGPSQWRPRLEELVGMSKVPTEYGGSLVVPGGLYKKSTTRLTHLSAGKVLSEVVSTVAGRETRFKWSAKPGDLRFSLSFKAGPPPAAATGGAPAAEAAPGATGPRIVRQGSATLAELALAPGGSAEVVKAADFKECDKHFVAHTHKAPVDGWYLAVWDNKAGWRSRDVCHRYDALVNGKAVAPSGEGAAVATFEEGEAKPDPPHAAGEDGGASPAVHGEPKA